ncbi:MAG: hypothetical protein COB65_11000 [Thalassobium sp.]|nr:MAG: hypothetical protein COB65_11000 [Thalassobium sp.]
MIKGGSGWDKVFGGNGSDSVAGGWGNDYINTSGNVNDFGISGSPDRGYPGLFAADDDPNDDADVVRGGQGNDTIITGDDGDLATGGKGNDYIDGGFDDDTLNGNAGNDTIIGGEGSDLIRGGAGNDTIYAGLDPSLPDLLNLADDAGDLVTDNGQDIVWGGSGNDVIYGADDDDTLYGGSGDDMLNGGVDDDMLTGGQGNDVFGFGAGDGSDTITDFTSGADKIALTGFDGLTFDDIFLSQDESAAIIAAGDVTIRLENTDADDLAEEDFVF